MEEEPGDLSTLLDHDLLQQALQEVSGLESFGSSRQEFTQNFTTQGTDNLVNVKPGQSTLVSFSHHVPVTSLAPATSHTTSAITAPVVNVPVNNRVTASHLNSGGMSQQPLILVPSILPHGSIAFIQPQVGVTTSSQNIIVQSNKSGLKRQIQALLPKPVQPKPPQNFYPTFKLKNTSIAPTPMQHMMGASMSSTPNLLPAGTIIHNPHHPYLPMTKMTILPPGRGAGGGPVTTNTQVLQHVNGGLHEVNATALSSPIKNSNVRQERVKEVIAVSPQEKKPRAKRRKKLLGKRKQSNANKQPIIAKSSLPKAEVGNNMPSIMTHIPQTSSSRLESTINPVFSTSKDYLHATRGELQPKSLNSGPSQTVIDLKEKYKANHISNFIPNYKTIQPPAPKNDFSFTTFLKEVMKTKPRGPGRPKKPFSDEEKKQIKTIKAEIGVGEHRIRALDLLELGEKSKKKKRKDELSDEDEGLENDKEIKTMKCGITRSGRISKLPKNTINDLRANGIRVESPSPPITEPLATTGAITNMSFAPPPAVDVNSLSSHKNSAKFLRWTCKVCGKFYLGSKHVALHLKNFPDHGFHTPPETKEEVKTFNIENWIKDTEATAILDLVGPKLFDNFSLWELLGKKVALKQLGTPEILSSIFADIQALVMDLKNMVDQCINNVRINNDSFSVIFSPMISTILGQNGGGERFVLPYNQIPVHYHTLLGFPKGLKNSQPPDLLSPDSTNDIFPPEEENSQMSMASDTPERPLVEKVVLEANLGSRAEDIDEETQDSTRMGKRRRLDSESHSAASPPPPQTPEFLNHEDESNLSSSSNLGKDLNLPDQANIDDITVRPFSVSESKIDDVNNRCTSDKDIITRTASQITNQSGRSIFTESAKTKLPSFSSIICGSPKSSIAETADLEENSPIILDSHHMSGSNKHESNKNLCLSNSSSHQQDNSSVSVSQGSDFGPTVLSNISCSNVNQSYQQRRSSVDEVLLCGATNKLVGQNNTHTFSPGKGLEQLRGTVQSPTLSTVQLDRSSGLCTTDPISVHSSSISPDTQLRRYSFESDSLSDMIKERSLPNITSPLRVPTPGTNSFQTTSFSVFSTVSSPSQLSMNGSNHHPMNTTNNIPMFLETPPRDSCTPDVNPKDFQLFTCTPFTKPTVPLPLNCLPDIGFSSGGNLKKTDTMLPTSARQHSEFECSTHVTFSDLNHPIPSVSPFKEPIDFECTSTKSSSMMPARVTASPNLLNDIESVLRETDEFSFHSALSSSGDNVPGPSKTPEKLLTSIPPAEIMKKKTSMIFEDFTQNS